jgi:hypothetical protein
LEQIAGRLDDIHGLLQQDTAEKPAKQPSPAAPEPAKPAAPAKKATPAKSGRKRTEVRGD